jgi:hypothetical protein
MQQLIEIEVGRSICSDGGNVSASHSHILIEQHGYDRCRTPADIRRQAGIGRSAGKNGLDSRNCKREQELNAMQQIGRERNADTAERSLLTRANVTAP